MYDNLDLILYKDKAPGVNFIDEVAKHLTTVREPQKNDYGVYIIGYLDSLKVSITDNRVKIYDSSICKYYLGDNFKTLNKSDTRAAITQISDILHLPFDAADVTRIDFSNNLIMKNKPKDYYKYLGQLQYFERLEQSNGLYYNTGDRQILFYGKVKEQKLKGQPIPPIYKNQNVLRYEMRYLKHIKQQLNRPEIKANLLYDEVFYRDLVNRWKQSYLNINKINLKMSTIKPTGSTKELIENLAIFQLLELGQPQLIGLVKEWQNAGIISRKQAQDHRRKIKELTKLKNTSPDNNLINELDKKIKQASAYC